MSNDVVGTLVRLLETDDVDALLQYAEARIPSYWIVVVKKQSLAGHIPVRRWLLDQVGMYRRGFKAEVVAVEIEKQMRGGNEQS